MQSSETTTVLIHLVASVSLGILLLVIWGCIRFQPFRKFVCWALARWIDPGRFDEGTYAFDFFAALRAWLNSVREPIVWELPTDVQVKCSDQRFSLGRQIGTSHCYNVYPTTDNLFFVKFARDQTGIRTLSREHQVLQHLRSHAFDTPYIYYLPSIVQQTRILDMPAWIYGRLGGQWNSAERIASTFRGGLSGEHIAWMFNRILEVIGFAHDQGTAHSAILPQHLVYETGSHSMQLVDWTHAKRIGRTLTFIPKRYRSWYPNEATVVASPQTDIYMAAKVMVVLSGANPSTNEIPHTIPAPVRQFLKACLLESARMRPDSAWELHEEFRDILQLVYGASTFHVFPSAEKPG